MLLNSIYIRCIWGFILAAAVFYCLPYIFVSYDQEVYSNGTTLYDLVYYNSDKVFKFSLSMLFSIMCLILESNFRQKISLSYLKYLSYTISAILFTAMCFHFYYFNIRPTIELVIYAIFAVVIAIRMWYTIGNLKHIIALCKHRLHNYH